jgi:type II secretory pathway pseudopilin PulG
MIVSGPRPRPRGLTAIDVLVVLLLIGILALVLLMTVPRGREQARLAACRKNLSQIGLALALYDQLERSLPVIEPPGTVDPPGVSAPPGPLKILLETLDLSDFLTLAPGAPVPGASGPVPGEIPVPGFVCASDPNATAGVFRAPISYRATTGDDFAGTNGVFAPGRRTSIAKIEEGDGAGFTAAFSERFVGDNLLDHFSPANYAVAPGPLPPQGCTLVWLKDHKARWRGDAGSSWIWADYRSTLYNHGLPPCAPLSCMAADGSTAFLGASSGHVRGVNMLLLDASVKLVLPTIDPKVWKEFAAVSEPTTSR